MPTTSHKPPRATHLATLQLRNELSIQSKRCIECDLCRQECPFLQKYGSPKQIAETYDPLSPKDQAMPFECSLCGLCAAVCPMEIDPAAMFLEMRRESVITGDMDLAKHHSILAYEKKGASNRYSYYGLPADCDTIFFPGCTLPGTRPEKIKHLFAHLQESISNLGMVLDCCTKPSHDLGKEKYFQTMFTEMKEYLIDQGVKNVLVACPNCYRVFKEHGGPLEVKTVYEHLLTTNLPTTTTVNARVTVHDPCSTRNDDAIHTSIRRLLKEKQLDVEEMKYHGRKTLCCGEGGAVSCLNPEFSKNWGKRCGKEAADKRIVTYCAGCAHFLNGVTPTSHILDLLFDPKRTLAGKAKVAKAPWTYLNRILLKSHFKKTLRTGQSRKRTFAQERRGKKIPLSSEDAIQKG